MKRMILAVCISVLSSVGFSQTCEQREVKLLDAMKSFSAGLLYNTYGAIGSIVDGFAHEAYKAETVNNLLESQKKLMDNLVTIFEELKTGGDLIAKTNIDYANSAISVLQGLKMQAQLMLDYVKNKTQKSQDAYNAQRTKNWEDISKLMGLDG